MFMALLSLYLLSFSCSIPCYATEIHQGDCAYPFWVYEIEGHVVCLSCDVPGEITRLQRLCPGTKLDISEGSYLIIIAPGMKKPIRATHEDSPYVVPKLPDPSIAEKIKRVFRKTMEETGYLVSVSSRGVQLSDTRPPEGEKLLPLNPVYFTWPVKGREFRFYVWESGTDPSRPLYSTTVKNRFLLLESPLAPGKTYNWTAVSTDSNKRYDGQFTIIPSDEWERLRLEFQTLCKYLPVPENSSFIKELWAGYLSTKGLNYEAQKALAEVQE